jgi:hypothetical protein
MTNIHQQIEQEREAAREACSVDATSAECAAAWDAVEELQAEASHQREQEPEKSELDKFCDANPDADECRIYED